ncbi:hypothetical protein Z043_125272, partial [Scleropages formosus]
SFEIRRVPFVGPVRAAALATVSVSLETRAAHSVSLSVTRVALAGAVNHAALVSCRVAGRCPLRPWAPGLTGGKGIVGSASSLRSPPVTGLVGGSDPVTSWRQLPENWTDTRETLLEGMAFNLKYLGMTLVEQPKGEELSAAAVKRIVATVSLPRLPAVAPPPRSLVRSAKASGKKLQKVTLKVSPRGIVLYDSATNQQIENVSIYSQHNDTLECHAYLCAKRKVAQAVTLTVAQAFKVAFEFWQAAKDG